MKHCLDITQLSHHEITALIQRALYFKNNAVFPIYSQESVAHLFYENSTRTRVSFELAAKNLAMKVVNLDLQSSSEMKGEIIEDTVRTLAAMGINIFVIRHEREGLPQMLAQTCDDSVHIINAGDGAHAHPSQALLDLMTIVERHSDLSKLKIAIVGDIRHSRVANSLQCIFATMGIGELTLVAPEVWKPASVHFGRVTASLQDGIVDADVVICLRVQRERLLDSEHLDLPSYRRDYALTRATLLHAKTGAMVMHPGPLNRGVEIDSDVADGLQSFILQQVRNGVFMRMAILERCIQS